VTDVDSPEGTTDWIGSCPEVEEPEVPEPVKVCDQWFKYGAAQTKIAEPIEGATFQDSINKWGSNWAGAGWTVLENRCKVESSALALNMAKTDECKWTDDKKLSFTKCGN